MSNFVTKSDIVSAMKSLHAFENAKKKAERTLTLLIGERQVSKNKRKKLTRMLLKQFIITDEDATQERIRRSVCFACGKWPKPTDISVFYWLCSRCEVKYLGETRTSTKTIKSYGPRNSQIVGTRRYLDSSRFYDQSRFTFEEEEEKFTLIDGSLFADDESTVAKGA